MCLAWRGYTEAWAHVRSTIVPDMWYGISIAVGILVVVALATWFIRGRRV
jgi:hypothetical protein